MDKHPTQEVAARFATLPKDTSARLLDMRAMLQDVAKADPRIGPLSEELKWNQPAYLPKHTQSGTTLRLWISGNEERPALFVPCSTTIVDWAKERYSEEMNFAGNRAIVPNASTPPEALRHIMAHALTYKLKDKGAP